MACEHCTNSSYLMREAIRGHQRSSEVIRGHQRSSEVIRGHQRSSEVIRGHHSSYKPNVSSGGQSSR